MLFLCCHPALSPPSQLALTLRAVGGLTTEQIARAFLVPDATMGQRISRAKQTIRAAGGRFERPPETEWAGRLQVVLQVLYLMFNEGYTATSGPDLQRPDLTAEAIRLARDVHRLLPDDPEVTGLLALMLLTDARRPARTRADGSLVPLDRQDRGRWSRAMIDEGTALIAAALARGPAGPYQVQAAIAAIHDEAARAEDTDWGQILVLYETLEVIAPNPMVTLNRAVAVAMVRGPAAGLELLATLEADPRMAGHHRLHAVRAHLLERAGDARGGDRRVSDGRAAHHQPARTPLSRGAGRPPRRLTRAPGQSFVPSSSIHARALAAISSPVLGSGRSALPLPSERGSGKSRPGAARDAPSRAPSRRRRRGARRDTVRGVSAIEACSSSRRAPPRPRYAPRLVGVRGHTPT